MKQIAITVELPNERATLSFGKRLGQLTNSAVVIYFYGDLGVGKTTLVRGFLNGRGYMHRVKSPTYTFVESYDLHIPVHHFDLYRLKTPEEIECIDLKEFFKTKSIILVEWPEKGRGFLPEPCIILTMELLEQGRKLHIAAANLIGQAIIDKLNIKQIQANIHEN